MINKFKEITEEMVELYERKNSDYGDSVHDTYVKYGPVSFLVRMEDKINRVKTLTEKEDCDYKVKDEKVRDSLINLANYAILMVMEMEREALLRVGCVNINSDGVTIGIDHGTNSGDTMTWAFLTEGKDEDNE